ncbi:MAG TPA: D-glycerate dehydrogenase [Pseudonocardia sp.]|jgi:glyoxylate reductase|uniref:2-hydroxyacid dehydrogenase n=1 Tax=Pseudonocardia sp. TaxID=60912 RepID=UPI002B4AD2E4|nr:D-glycerate dehydrogenase [Pseudonocardia sp.]HLU60349.1 D-glycerate dehydrogenase [Pseudonocardia sp.]
MSPTSGNRVFVSQEIFEDALEEFDGTGIEVDLRRDHHPLPAAELRAVAADYDGLICLLTDRIDAEFLAACPRLRVVANVAVGFDNIDVPAATRAGVAVTNTPRVLTDATADLAFTLLLATARRIPEGDAFLRAGKYTHWRVKQEQMGVDVFGATLGLFGLGQIGRAVARRARGFDMTVLYHDVQRLPADDEEALGVTYVEFDELLSRSDFVSVHAPLTDATRHRFDAAAFARMKPTAMLINTARGPIVDEAALAAALRDGVIAGAGLDVFEREPEVDPQLLQLRERVVLLPHLGSATETTRREMCRTAARNVRDALTGKRPENLVNPEVLSGKGAS